MSFALLKKWSQLTHHYPQFPEGMELIGVYGDDDGIPNEDGIEEAKEMLDELDYVGYDSESGFYYKVGNPDDTFDLGGGELEWDLGDFVIAFEDLLEEFAGYPEQLQLDILKEKYGCGDVESEVILALLKEVGYGYVEDVEKYEDNSFGVGGDSEYFVMSSEEAEAIIINDTTYYIFKKD